MQDEDAYEGSSGEWSGEEEEATSQAGRYAEDDGDEDGADESSGTTSASAPPTRPAFRIVSTAALADWVRRRHQIDVGGAGSAVWSVSSAKHGNGVRHLMRCHDLSTFWQSDGVLPHVIRVQLGQLTALEALAVYVNSAVDQSYSPRVIRVKAGTHEGDMVEVAKADIGAGQECGWVVVQFGETSDDAEVGNEEEEDEEDEEDGEGDDDANSDAMAADDEEQARRRVRDARICDAAASSTSVPAPAAAPLPYYAVAAALGHPASPAPSSASPAFVASAPPQASAAAMGAVGSHNNPADRWLWCTLVDICICENQFNGRDCHLRGIRLMGPRYEELERVCNIATCAYTPPRLRRSRRRLRVGNSGGGGGVARGEGLGLMTEDAQLR